MARAHAILSPSAAHRWMNCPAAPSLERGMADEGSEYAREGTAAHALAAALLLKGQGIDARLEESAARGLARYMTAETEECAATYAAIVLERLAQARRATPDARLLVETRLRLGEWIPGGEGTADAIIIADDLLEVIDYKHGKGVRVSAETNPQMMIYALGALRKYGDEYDIRRVRMTIVQPRLDNLSEEELTAQTLTRWGDDVLRPAAAVAYYGGALAAALPGAWCKFCRAKSRCKALAGKAAEAAATDYRLLTASEIAAEVLPSLPAIRAWLADAEAHALRMALAGETLPGYKVVRGRSSRRVSDPEAFIAALTGAGYDRDAVVRPTEPRTLTELEQLVGRKRLAEIAGEYIVKPEGKPALVAEDDKRPALDPVAEDFGAAETDDPKQT